MIRQQQFEYAYIFGAVCPQRDRGVALVMPSVGTDCMQEHLNEISQHVEREKHAILVLDRATWHTTKKLKIPYNLSLLSLPTASPELNPIEQVWQVLRDRYLANRCFSTYTHIVECCCQAWNSFTEKLGAIKQLCSRTWASIAI